MIIQPLVRKHASKQDQPVWGLLLIVHPLLRVIAKELGPKSRLLELCGAKRDGAEVDGQMDDVPHGQDDGGRLEQSRHEKRANGAGQIRGRNAGMVIQRRITRTYNMSAIVLRVHLEDVHTQVLRNLEADRCLQCRPSIRMTPSTPREDPLLSCKRSWQREERQDPERPEPRPDEPVGAHRSEAARRPDADTGHS